LGEAQERVQPGDINESWCRAVPTRAASTACRSPPTRRHAHRADLFEQKGLAPAKTWDGYIANAKALNDLRRYGVTIAMKSDMVCNEMNAVFNTTPPAG
jgi:hypothetical protein